MRALIADDEPLLRAELRDALAQCWPELQVVAEVADGRAAVAAALQQRPEVAFLDVNMPHLDGTAAARQLRERGYAGELVFVTAYDQFAVAAFDARAIDYLVKPLDLARLGETVTRLRARLGAAPAAAAAPATAAPAEPSAAASPWLRVTRGLQTRLVALDDIACLRAVPGYTQLVTREGEHLVELALKTLQQRLDPQCFVQIHRAAIVNLRFVEHIEREASGRCVVELKHGLGRVEASRSGAELLRSL
jgi:DNA-binding LytR/AlgR family response regulator